MSVGEIASALRITHVSVSQACRSMEKAGIVKSATSAKDARRRNISLTPKGRALVRKLTALWDAFNYAAEELNAEAGDLVKLLDPSSTAISSRPSIQTRSCWNQMPARSGAQALPPSR